MKQTVVAMRLLSLACVAFAMGSAFAADNHWTNGSGDGKWGTPGNWSRNHVPDPAPDVHETAYFPSGADATVEIDRDYAYYAIELQTGTGKVTLTGTGTLSIGEKPTDGTPSSSRALRVYSGREFVLDGPTLSAYTYTQEGPVTVKSGSLTSANKDAYLDGVTLSIEGGTVNFWNQQFVVTNGAVVSVTGGDLHVDKTRLCIGGKIVVDGGCYHFDGANGGHSISPAGTFSYLSGTVDWNCPLFHLADWQQVAFPPNGTTTTVAYANSPAVRIDVTNALPIAGTLLITNAAANSGGYLFSRNIPSKKDNEDTGPIPGFGGGISGGGTLLTQYLQFDLSGSGRHFYLDLGNLCLRDALRTSPNRGSCHFSNGITFGAWGDWNVDLTGLAQTSFLFHAEGPVRFDTLDYFDRMTPRTISCTNFNLAAATALSVAGGGQVGLTMRETPNLLADLKVESGCVLSFDSTEGKIVAHRLLLGARATLVLDLDCGQTLDVVQSATFGDDAKIALRFAGEDAEGAKHRRPVYFAPYGTEPDLTLFDTTGISQGWNLAKQGNAVYLTDGTELPGSGTSDANTLWWLGTTDGSWKTAANWYNAKPITSDTSSYVLHVNGWKNTVMTNDVATTARAQYVYVEESAGPVTIVGFPISMTTSLRMSGNDPTLRSDSDYPFVIDAKMGKPNAQGDFNVRSYGNGYVVLPKGGDLGTTKNHNTNGFEFVGDVRLGDHWKNRTLTSYYIKNNPAKRPSSLTLLPNAEMLIYGQATSLNQRAQISVLSDATFTVEGTSFGFEAFANTHFVDGTWTVRTPFCVKAEQTFCGTGTVRLEQGLSGAAGLTLAGGITLETGEWTSEGVLAVRDEATVRPLVDEWKVPALALNPRSRLTFDTSAGSVRLAEPLDASCGEIFVTGGKPLSFPEVGVGRSNRTLLLRTKNRLAPSAFPSDMVVVEEKEDHAYAYYGYLQSGVLILVK